nr:unnamed protein product [Spirometra erinaceieuropaei]
MVDLRRAYRTNPAAAASSSSSSSWVRCMTAPRRLEPGEDAAPFEDLRMLDESDRKKLKKIKKTVKINGWLIFILFSVQTGFIVGGVVSLISGLSAIPRDSNTRTFASEGKNIKPTTPHYVGPPRCNTEEQEEEPVARFIVQSISTLNQALGSLTNGVSSKRTCKMVYFKNKKHYSCTDVRLPLNFEVHYCSVTYRRPTKT